MHTLDIKINRDYIGYYAGQVVSVPCDQHNVPLEQVWRRRLDDARLDGLCEIVPVESPQESFPMKTKNPNGKVSNNKRNTRRVK